MTHLNIQQGSNVEIVTALVILKLYDAALSVPEPLSGEEDAAYMSGNLLVAKAYRSLVEYLTSRFDDLSINVTVDYYIDFEDSTLGNKLINVYSADGVGITEAEAANITITQQEISSVKNEVTSFNEFNKFTKANTFTSSGINSRFRDFVNMTSINLTALLYLNGSDFRNTGITVVNAPSLIAIGSLNGYGVFGLCTNLTTVESLGNITILPSNCFDGCTHLTTVNLPQSCTELRSESFRSCTMLSSINLENVVTIGNLVFNNDSNLTNLNLSSLGRMGSLAFVNTNAKYTITLPLEYYISTGYYGTFSTTSCLKTITNINAVEAWSKITLDLPPIKSDTDEIILNFQNATEIYSSDSGQQNAAGLCNVNYNSFKIKALYAPLIARTITKFFSSFNRLCPSFGTDAQCYLLDIGRKMILLLYFKNLNELSINAFGGLICPALVINNTTPPTVTSQHYNLIHEWRGIISDVYCDSWGNLSLMNGNTLYNGGEIPNNYYEDNNKLACHHEISHIYVPDSAVTTYQNATGWSSVSNLIMPISSLNSGVIYANEQDWITAGKPVGLIADHLGLSTADLATFVSANNLTYYVAPSS